MALFNCPNCGHKISQHATSCPRCGYQLQRNYQHPQGYYEQGNGQSNKNNNNYIILVLSAVIIALLATLFATLRGCDNNSSNSDSNNSSSTTLQPADTTAATTPPVDSVKVVHDTIVVIEKEKEKKKEKKEERVKVPKKPRITNNNYSEERYTPEPDYNDYNDNNDNYDNNYDGNLHLSLSGQFSGDYNSTLTLNGDRGRWTSYEHKNRTVRLKSYDPSTGRLILAGYSSESSGGEYLGEFDGYLNGNHYSGTFYHTNGKTREFNYY